MAEAENGSSIPGAQTIPEAIFWILVSVAAFGGWSAFWAVGWFAFVLSEFNDDSAADEEFAGAFVASAIIALVTSAWARAFAIRRGVEARWPAGSWIIGYFCAAIFLGLWILWASNRQIEG
jgi:hypothetical protein